MPPSHIITFTIPSPILQTGEHFEIKYRLQGAGSWISAPDATNVLYSLPVSVTGTYEIAITLVKVDGTHCDTVIYTVPVTTPSCECMTSVTGTLESLIGGQWQLRINYVVPTTWPKCGITVTYTGNDGVTRTVTYTGIVPNPIIITYAVYNQAYTVLVDFDCCGNNANRCAILDIPIATPSCVPSTWGPAENQRRVTGSPGNYFLTLILTAQSIPATNTFTAIYTQTSVSPPQPPDSGTFVMSGTGPTFMIPVNPHGTLPYSYDVDILDICGNKVHVS